MKTKECTTCHEVKPLDQFWKCSKTNDGHQYWCISCATAHNKKYQIENKETLKKKDEARRRRTRTYQLERNRRYYAENAAKKKAYRSTDTFKQRAKERYSENKDKYHIYGQVRRALKTGVITRESCELEGISPCSGPLVLHHHDYDKPLDCNTLCHDHHTYIHRILREIARADKETA